MVLLKCRMDFFQKTEEDLLLQKSLTLWLKARCLNVLISFGEKHNIIEDGNLESLLIHIRTVFLNVNQDLQRLGVSLVSGYTRPRTPMHMGDLCSSVLERLELLNPDIQQVYNIISKSSTFITGMSHETVMENLDNLLDIIQDLMSHKPQLVAPVKEKLEAAQTSLGLLRNFLGFTAKRCNNLEKLKDLLNHAQLLILNMSCLFYLCSVSDKMNDRMMNEMKMHLSFELLKFSPAQPEVREIYIEALKASKSAQQGVSTVVDEFDLGFFDSLPDNILDLSDAQLSFIASDKDQILSLHAELRILIISFAMYKPSEAHRDPFLNINFGNLELYRVSKFFLERISVVIIDMGCLIYSLHNGKQNRQQFKTTVSNLQVFIKIANEDFRKACDTYISKSRLLKTKFRTTDAQGMMIHSLMRISEKISNHLWDGRSHHISKVLQNEMQSLIGAFSNLTAKQHLDDGELEIQMSRLNDIRNWTEFIYSLLKKSRSSPVSESSNGHHKMWFFVLVEGIKMVKMEFKYLQNQRMHSTSKPSRNMNPQEKGKKTMTDNSERTGEQLSSGSKMSHSLPVGMDGIDGRNSNLDLIFPQKDEHKALRLKAGLLKVFLSCKGMWHIEDANLKVLLTRIHSVFQSADQDLQRLWSDLNIQISPIKVQCLPKNLDCLLSTVLSMLQLLEPDIRGAYIILSKSSRFITGISDEGLSDEALMENLNALLENIEVLLKCNIELLGPLKEELEGVQKRLRFLRNFLGFTAKRCSTLGKLDLLIHSEFLAVKISCLLFLCCDNEKMNDQMMNEMKMHLSSELQKFCPAQPDVREIYIKALKASKSAEGISNSALGNEFVSGFLDSLRDDILELSDSSSLRDQCDELQSQWAHFLEIAYQTEFIIESFVIGSDPIYCHRLGLFDVIEGIKTIKIALTAIKIKMTDETSVHKLCLSNQDLIESNFPKPMQSLESKERLAHSPKNKADMSSKERPAHEKNMIKLEIFGEKAEEIRVQLTNGSPKLNIISIVGMPGIGKTTLADSVFQHTVVTHHFHVRARCSVSQVHDKRRLLLEILQQVTAEFKQDGDDDLDQKLYKSLKGRRFLILLDDIWNIRAWNDMKASFPDDENGSRIVFTSRFEDIASQTVLGSTKFHLSPLSQEKSWEMLMVKLFGNKSCPPELVSVGHEIAANCNGLPLTIDLVAGVLRMKERKEWKRVAESLVTILFEDPERRCWKALELSYQNLPDDLKPCFLYFAAFPEDANVSTWDLILLWIAEGFVKLEKGETRSLEDVAKDILDKLIRRSLVTVSKRGPLGGVVESRVHDLLHEFAVAKAQEENFMLKIDGKAEFPLLFSAGGHDLLHEFFGTKESFFGGSSLYRQCIFPNPNYWRQFPVSNPSGTRTRAVIRSYVSWALSGSYGSWFAFSLNLRTFELLRVLYIPNFPCGYRPELFTLIHLRLLAISIFRETEARDIISNIHKLWNLETFIMYGRQFPEAQTLLLDKICNMVRLRHFCFNCYIHFRYLREEIWQKASFANLQTLYNLKASYEEDIEKILKLVPNLVELKVLFYNPDGDSYPFPKLNFLKKLKSLEVTHLGGYRLCPCNFPPYLKQLVLSNFKVPWTEISMIGNLEYLEVLELKNNAFKGPVWDMIDGQFPKLKYLSLSNMGIEEWNASKDHLSCLEQLHVAKCKELKELPSCLEEIATLQVIKLFNCTEAAENSAKRIKEEQEQMAPEQLVVNITSGIFP